MADVMEAFMRGQSQAQAEQEHAQGLKDSKLRQQVLKHQIDSMKLDDQLRQQQLVKGRADLGLGQGGEEDLSAPATGNLQPSQIGALRGAFLQRALENAGVSPDAAAESAAAGPANAQPSAANATAGGAAAPAPAGRLVGPADASTHPPLVLHQDDTLPQTHAELQPSATMGNFGDAAHPEMKRAGHVWIPPLKVPELGIDVPGMWYSAKAAAAEQSARAIALKRAELPVVNIPPGGTAFDQATKQPLYTNPNRRSNTPLPQQYNDALQAGDTETAKQVLKAIHDTQPQGRQSLETMLLDARSKGDKKQADLIKGVLQEVAGARRDPNAAADREESHNFTENMRLYTEDVANGWKKQADALKAWTAKYPGGKLDDATPDPPEYTPASFSEWLGSHQTETDAARGKKPAAAAAKPGAGKSVTEAELVQIAKTKGTTVDAQRARFKAGGYAIAK